MAATGGVGVWAAFAGIASAAQASIGTAARSAEGVRVTLWLSAHL
jgi:hypothetical protein